MEKKYLVTVSGMFDNEYAIDGIERVPGGVRPIPYSIYLDFEVASKLRGELELEYPKYVFKLIQVRG